MVKRVGKLLLVLIVLVAGVLGTMRLGWWNPSYESVKAAQAGPPSRFEQYGTVNLHIRDEGQGPVVLMLHSSMTNLREWDAWADALKGRYRVIRFDWPPYGLSTDSAPSTGMPGVVSLIEKVVAAKKLEKFSIVGTSSGATIATLYAARHPEQVEALALSALPLEAPPTTKFSKLMWSMVWVHEKLVPNYYPRAYYRQSLSELYGKPERLKDETVDWYYQTNTLPGGFARVRQYWEANKKAVWAKGAGDDAANVTAPILLQWGDRDPVLPTYLADKAVKQFSAAKVTLIHYPDLGHYPMLELPQETGRDLVTFLDQVHAK
jgi:pimeloyl-ACP methyl ester carboxylesterase